MNSKESVTINHVSDTALWVAYYRAQETKRPDALFRDPLADALIGERGKKIAEHMAKIGRYTAWSVVSRTVVIDRFIEEKIKEGVDTIVNLGAGLDTRPYRMNLPAELNWIEVDYDNIIHHKESVLKNEIPKCRLTRVILDLADLEARKEFLASLGLQSKKILVLTEGVIPYLTEEQVASLAHDLYAQPHILYWITEYMAPQVYRYLKTSQRMKQMKKAPFLFFPENWNGFFEAQNWIPEKTKYSAEIAIEFKRKLPVPWFAVIIRFFAKEKFLEKTMKMSGHTILKRK